MTYLKLMKLRHGLLLNFNVELMKKGLNSNVMKPSLFSLGFMVWAL